MYPVLFEIFGFAISSFGVMLSVAFLVGAWLTSLRMREEGLDPEWVTILFMYVMGGGIIGSRLYFAADVSIRHDASFFALLFSREGLTFYGGLIGGAAATLLAARVHHLPLRPLANAMAAPMAVGQGIGRIGCFLVGDDYGRPTDLPWGIAFPEGAPPTVTAVHPTQLYEMAWLFGVAALLWRRRQRSPLLAGEYLALNGAGRFVIELWRVNPPVALGLTEPQWIALGLIVIGGGLWLRLRARGQGREEARVPRAARGSGARAR